MTRKLNYIHSKLPNSLNLYLSKRDTAPATTGDATLVPDKERQPPLINNTETAFSKGQSHSTNINF